jgi:hypothetical protein
VVLDHLDKYLILPTLLDIVLFDIALEEKLPIKTSKIADIFLIFES